MRGAGRAQHLCPRHTSPGGTRAWTQRRAGRGCSHPRGCTGRRTTPPAHAAVPSFAQLRLRAESLGNHLGRHLGSSKSARVLRSSASSLGRASERPPQNHALVSTSLSPYVFDTVTYLKTKGRKSYKLVQSSPQLPYSFFKAQVPTVPSYPWKKHVCNKDQHKHYCWQSSTVPAKPLQLSTCVSPRSSPVTEVKENKRQRRSFKPKHLFTAAA